MNMHRAGKQGEWTNIPTEERSLAQKIAAKTDGNITPGNIVSVAGGAAVLSGLKDVYKGKTKRGIIKIGIGRVGDLIDGTVADKTKTKGPKGEAVDAGVDKALMAASIPVLITRGALTLPAAGLLSAQNLASGGIALEAKKRDVTLHPSENGKKAVAAQWSTIGLYAMASAARKANWLSISGNRYYFRRRRSCRL
jgi:phosphatidylglycerophosphate synthase